MLIFMSKRYFDLRIVVAILWYFIIIEGCTSLSIEPTKPNEPYSGPYQSGVKSLSDKNSLLAQELAKLPEFQDGISEEEAVALENLVNLYNNNSDLFNSAFDNMYEVGNPEVRKYCTPLQALFWLSYETPIQEIEPIFQDFSLNHLLDTAWRFEKENTLSKSQLLSVIDGTKDVRLKKEYIDYIDKNELVKLQKAIFYDYQRNSKFFNRKAAKIIKSGENKKDSPRWDDFKEVTDRLNSPELVNYYEWKRFSYEYYWNIPGYSDNNPDLHYVFKKNKGDCAYITAFTVYCLKKAGYRAYTKYVSPNDPRFRFHAITVFEQNGKRCIMDNGSVNKKGIRCYSEDNE